MAVNKVVYGTTVLVDLTEDTVTPETLLLGQTAHRADGEPIAGTLDPNTPWAHVEVGEITPNAATTQFEADTTQGTPLGLIITLISTNDLAVTSNAIISACWVANPVETIIGKVLCYYKTASNRTSTTTYPTYANGVFSLNKSLRAGWTYYYCIVYGN